MKKESIKNRWAILTQSSSVDRDNNTLSLFDIVEEVTLQVSGELNETNNIFPINLELVSFWERDLVGTPVDLPLKIVLKDPSNKVLLEQSGNLKMEPQHKRSRFRAKFYGMRVTQPGVYNYEILSLEPNKTEGKEVMARAPFEIKINYQAIKSPFQSLEK